MNRADRRRLQKGIASPDYATHQARILHDAMEFHRAGDFESAVLAYRDVLRREPDSADAWCNLGGCLAEMGRYDESIYASQDAIARNPKIPDAHNNLGGSLLQIGDAGKASISFGEATRLAPDNWTFWRNRAACLLYIDVSAKQIELLHREIGRRFDRKVKSPAYRHDRIRIGFVSSDLRDHVVANTLRPIVEGLSRSKFDVYLYGHDSARDAVTSAYTEHAALNFIDGRSDADAAALIRRNEIDVLFFIAGHLDRNRPLIAAHRAAPIQISAWDVATSGLSAMGYLLCDPYTLPVDRDEWVSERRLYLSPIYLAQAPNDFPAPTQGVREGPITFGCFNNPAKISPACLSTWGRILARLPGSHLVLGYKTNYSQESLRSRVNDAIDVAGADPRRVRFITEMAPTQDAHLRRYNDIDIALDTFPFSGSTTTFHALAMGVPLVTLPWNRMAGRWSYSMLKALGWDSWIATSLDDYVAKAVHLASMVRNATNERQYARQLLARSPLCGVDSYVRRFESAIEEIVELSHVAA